MNAWQWSWPSYVRKFYPWYYWTKFDQIWHQGAYIRLPYEFNFSSFWSILAPTLDDIQIESWQFAEKRRLFVQEIDNFYLKFCLDVGNILWSVRENITLMAVVLWDTYSAFGFCLQK